jgi:hypothetical protein
VARDPADRDDHGESRGHRPDGQRRPAPVAGQRGPGEPLLEAEQPTERPAGDAGDAAEQER